MSDTQQLPLSIQPVISYPREAKVGETYMMTIDLKTPGGEWLYEEEEYTIDLMLDTLPLFRCQAMGEPSLVLHRFGGTYGAAKFLLTAAQEEMQGKIRVTLVNKWGVPIRVLSLDKISVTQGVADNKWGVPIRVLSLDKISVTQGVADSLVPIGSYERVTSVPQEANTNPWRNPQNLRNPYIIGRPIREPERYFGREDLFVFIEDNLNADQKIILLYGQRRMGKSSAIEQFARKIDPQKFVFVCFDLQEYYQSPLNDILYNLAEKIIEELALYSDTIPIPSKERFQKNPNIFSDEFLPRVYQKLGNKKLALVLDEFDVLQVTDDNSFFKYLQSILNKQTNLFIIQVLGGYRDDLEHLFKLFSYPPSYEFGLLNEISTRRLITKPAEGILKYEEDAIKAIFRLSSGHPYFTQAICFNLFMQARFANQTTVNREDVEGIIEKTIESVTGRLAWLWDGLSINEKVVFSAVAEAQKIAIEQQKIFPEDPLMQLKNYRVIQTEELVKALKQLVDKGYLDDTERRVKIELVRCWLVQYHPLNQEIFQLQRINQEEINQISEQEIQLYRDGNLQDIIDHYETILTLNPNHFPTISVLAQKYLNVKNFDKALTLYTRAYQVNPIQNKEKLLQAREAYGENLRNQGKLINAKVQFEEVLEIEPDRESAKQQLVEINAELEQHEASQIEVDNQLTNLGWFGKAVAAIRRVIEG